MCSVRLDCRTLHRLLNDTPIGELSVTRVICGRPLSQRLEIRDQYRQLFKKVHESNRDFRCLLIIDLLLEPW